MVKNIDEWGNTTGTIKYPKCLKKTQNQQTYSR